MNDIVIVGAGGHAKVIVDMLLQNGEYDIAGMVDKENASGFWGIPVIGADEDLQDIYNSGIRNAFVALGSNKLRERLMGKLEDIGFKLVNVISKAAIVSEKAVLSTGIAIMPGAAINADAVISQGCIINTNASVDHECILGNFVHIAPGVNLAGKVSIGDLAFLGAGSCTADGVHIGTNVLVGAGTVVIHDVGDNCTVVGSPARRIR